MNARCALAAVFLVLLHPRLAGPAHGLSIVIPPSYLFAAGIAATCLVLALLVTRPMMRLACRRVT